MRRYNSCRAAPRVGWERWPWRFPKRRFYDLATGLSQTTGLPSVAPSVLPSGSASAASRALRIAAPAQAGRQCPVFHQRIDDGEEVRLAAPLRLAVTLDERAHSATSKARRHRACRLGDEAQPALDQLLSSA